MEHVHALVATIMDGMDYAACARACWRLSAMLRHADSPESRIVTHQNGLQLLRAGVTLILVDTFEVRLFGTDLAALGCL